VRAVADGAPSLVFDGRLRILFVSDTVRQVTVSGTRPYDSAPGGWRASMAQLDTTQAPYGDIMALHDRHCFIPTVSALDVDDTNLAFDLTALADPAAASPFDAVYWQPTNEEHVFISPLTAERLGLELAPPLVGVPGRVDSGIAMAGPWPNPSAHATRLRFILSQPGDDSIEVIDVTGRRVRDVARGSYAAGEHTVAWDLRDDDGRKVRPGLYFLRLGTAGETRTRRFVALP